MWLGNSFIWNQGHLCLILLQVPICFVPVQIFWASPKIWLHLVPPQKLLCRHKKTILLMPCPFTGPKMFCASPNIFWASPKIWLHLMPVTNILCRTKRWFAFSKIGFLCRHKSFWGGTKYSQIFGLVQKIWTGTKHFATWKRTRHKAEYLSTSI